jgi:hypothetical protein
MKDMDILQAALVGFEFQRAEIERKIADIQQRLGNRRGALAESAAEGRPAPRKRQMSAEGRARIAAAQKKRWAAVKKASGNAPKKAAAKPAGKRKISPEQKAALVERLQKARAAKAGKKSVGEAVPS